jgi:hypothetical protein
MCKTVTKQISVSGWNINGAYRKTSGAKANKIHDDEFQKIKKSDVIFLSETHTSYSDILLFDGYKSFMNCHSMESSKKRGGLVVFIKRNVLSGITLIDKSSSEMMWFKLSGAFFRSQRDLYICFIYISPVNSTYVKTLD